MYVMLTHINQDYIQYSPSTRSNFTSSCHKLVPVTSIKGKSTIDLARHIICRSLFSL